MIRVPIGGNDGEVLSKVAAEGDPERGTIRRRGDDGGAETEDRRLDPDCEAPPADLGKWGREPDKVAESSRKGVEFGVRERGVSFLKNNKGYLVMLDEVNEV